MKPIIQRVIANLIVCWVVFYLITGGQWFLFGTGFWLFMEVIMPIIYIVYNFPGGILVYCFGEND